MNAKEALRKVLLDNAKIEYKLGELAQLRAMATKVTAVMGTEVVARSRDPHTMENAVEKIIAAQEEINRLIDAYVDHKTAMSEVIDTLDNPAHIQVLTGRYFRGKTLELLSGEMGYSYRHICNLHGDAIAAVDRIMEERANDNL